MSLNINTVANPISNMNKYRADNLVYQQNRDFNSSVYKEQQLAAIAVNCNKLPFQKYWFYKK